MIPIVHQTFAAPAGIQLRFEDAHLRPNIKHLKDRGWVTCNVLWVLMVSIGWFFADLVCHEPIWCLVRVEGRRQELDSGHAGRTLEPHCRRPAV